MVGLGLHAQSCCFLLSQPSSYGELWLARSVVLFLFSFIRSLPQYPCLCCINIPSPFNTSEHPTQSVEIRATPEKPVFHHVVFTVILTHSSSPFTSHRYRLWLGPTSITDSDHPKEDPQQVGVDKCGLSCSYILAKFPTPPRHRYQPTGPSNPLTSVKPSHTRLFPWRQQNPSATKSSGVSSGTVQRYAAVQQVCSRTCDPPAGTGTYPGSLGVATKPWRTWFRFFLPRSCDRYSCDY